MGRAGAGATQGLQCPDCATELSAAAEGSSGVLRLSCPGCGGRFRAASPAPRIVSGPTEVDLAPSTVGPLKLRWRAMVLRILEHLYWSVTILGTLVMLALGGFVPVLGGWLRNEIDGWADVVATLGGVWFRVKTLDPDTDLGPVLARVDAPLLFSADRDGGAAARGQAAGAGPPDVSALLRRGRLGPVAGPDHRPAALPRADPGRAACGPGPRAGPPGPRRRHGRRAIGPLRRGTRAGRRAGRRPGPRAARGLGPVLPPRGRPG